MKISIIVAVSENGVIGKDNSLIWHLPDDMLFFKNKTKGHCILTGRKNYESIPLKFRPLPNRENIIVTRQENYSAPGANVFTSVKMAIDFARNKGEKELFVIGGAEIYRQLLPFANVIYLTRVHHNFDGDVFFNDPDPLQWREISRELHPLDLKHKYSFSFIVYERIQEL